MRKCPECGERLSIDARLCACGWGAKKEKPGTLHFDHECQWVANGYRCKYPVGRFDMGATTGMCIFHRNCTDGADGARIVKESQDASPEQYLRAAKLFAYGTKDIHEEFRKTLKKQRGDFSELKVPKREEAA